MTEQKTQHTPGPWSYFEQNTWGGALPRVRYGCVRSPGPDSFVIVNGCAPGGIEEEQRANARLIAAAPDLLAACENFVESYESSQSWPTQAQVDAARAALAQATGEGVTR